MIRQRYICSFLLHRDSAEAPARLMCRVKWNTSRAIIDLNLGFTINPEKWDKQKQLCEPRSFHGKRRIPAQVINNEIARYAKTVAALFDKYGDMVPEKSELRQELRYELGIEERPQALKLFSQAYIRYIEECSANQAWSKGTVKTIRSIGKRLEDSEIFETLDDFNKHNFDRLLKWLRNERGLSDVTIHRQIGYIRWFCHWAEGAGLLDNRDYIYFKPKIKMAQKPVIFLTWDELMRVRSFNGSEYQNRVRDVFLFCAFTSLRYSDAMALTWADVYDDCIKVVTQKTTDPLIIELNDYSKEVLERCAARRHNHKVLPQYANQVMNRELKDIMKTCGINSPVKITSYKAGERVEVTKPKYELIGTHAARRTFICNALMMGINPTTVMQWTGHNDYNSMKPYIAIADKERAKAMALFNRKTDTKQ